MLHVQGNGLKIRTKHCFLLGHWKQLLAITSGRIYGLQDNKGAFVIRFLHFTYMQTHGTTHPRMGEETLLTPVLIIIPCPLKILSSFCRVCSIGSELRIALLLPGKTKVLISVFFGEKIGGKFMAAPRGACLQRTGAGEGA